MPEAPHTITGSVVDDIVIPARGRWSGVVKRGQMMRIIDLEGDQGIDFLPLNANDYLDRYAAADTMKISGKIFVAKGTTLYSVNCNPMFTVVEDTYGLHDTIGGCCSPGINRTRYGAHGQLTCRENFIAELEKYGLGAKDIVANVNFFAYVPIGPNGEMDFRPPESRAGGYVDLRAEMDSLVVISNCPQINNPAAGFNPSAIEAVIWEPA